MRPSMRRATLLLLGGVVLGSGIGLLCYTFQTHMVFYYTPQELQTRKTEGLSHIRLGGLLEKGSLQRQGRVLMFHITDGVASLPVLFSGLSPRLLKEGQGVVVEGRWDPTKRLFQAHKLLIKHDEVYTPAACRSPS